MKWTGLRRLGWWALVTLAITGVAFAWPMSSDYQNPFFVFPIIAASAVGAVVSRQRPDNAIGWAFLAGGALSGVLTLSAVLTKWGLSTTGPLPGWWLAAAWVGTWIWFPILYLITIPPLLLFPSGLMSPRWRIVLWGAAIPPLLMGIRAATDESIAVQWNDSGATLREVVNPLAVEMFIVSPGVSDLLGGMAGIVFLVALLSAIVSVALRVKRSAGIERMQMRWFAFGVALFALLLPFEVAFSGEGEQPLWLKVVEAMVISAFPVACGIAIMRYRLYDIDRIISRTTSYAIVTGTLIVCYSLIVTAVSSLLPESGSLAVAAATLLVAALFRPLLRRVRVVVDRRFDRDHYDAGLAVAEFSQLLQSARGVDEVLGDLESVVDRVFGPSARAVWIGSTVGQALEQA